MTVAVEFGARDDAEGPLLAAAFRLLLAEGRPIPIQRLAAALGRDAEPVEQALDRLARAGRTRRNQAGEVTGSLGLSVEPTAHELTVEGARRWTWCAYDAVGILAALGANGRVCSRSPHTQAPIELPSTRADRLPAARWWSSWPRDHACRWWMTGARWSTSLRTSTPPRSGPPSMGSPAPPSPSPRPPQPEPRPGGPSSAGEPVSKETRMRRLVASALAGHDD